MSSKFKAREIARDEWNTLWTQVEKSNLLQTWEYGDAKAATESWSPIRFVVENINGDAIAIAQILTRTIPVLGGVARLNRGPLFLKERDTMSENDCVEVLNSILSLKRKNRWWLFFIAPELKDGQLENNSLSKFLAKPRTGASWGSSLLNLDIDEDQLLKNLNGKWRNLLRKAMKSDLKVRSILSSDKDFDKLIASYDEMKKKKNFAGIPSKLLRELPNHNGTNWSFNAYIAESNNFEVSSTEITGMLVSICHGDTATYLIGSSNLEGRKLNANYLLLWKSILDAKAFGCKYFDLGGINNNTPKGIAHFKRGVKGKEYVLIGEYFTTMLTLKNDS